MRSFAQRAKLIRNEAKPNEVVTGTLEALQSEVHAVTRSSITEPCAACYRPQHLQPAAQLLCALCACSHRPARLRVHCVRAFRRFVASRPR